MNEIRDPIYGFIKPSDRELKIINTSLLQRLRRIKQLAMAYLVYPGALHTRFDHSLGVFHIASLMADKLLPKEEDREKRTIIRFSALLHDIGHGPFSHVSEAVLNKFLKNKNEGKAHEQITCKLIEKDNQLKEILSPDEIKQVTGLLGEKGENFDYSIMKEIVSGPLDADKMDYLLRDSYFCGVKYGVFDLERLINTLESYTDGKNIRLTVKFDELNSLEQFVLAKYYMTLQVYRHKVRILSDAMIVRGLELGIEVDEIPFLKNLFEFREDSDYLQNYLDYSDDKVVNDILFSGKKGFAYEIFDRLYKRKLFKRIFSEKLKEIPSNPMIQDKLVDYKKNPGLVERIEKEIAKLDIFDCDEKYVIVNLLKLDSVKEMSKDDNEEKLMIRTKDENIVNFLDESEVLRPPKKESLTDIHDQSNVLNAIKESLNLTYFEVYAPVEFNSVKGKEEKLKRFKEGIMEILKKAEE
jgi:uncharacterized protein